MRYFKQVTDRYILVIGTGRGGTEITEAEYNEILSVLQNKPVSDDKHDYHLCSDLSWEEYELPENVGGIFL